MDLEWAITQLANHEPAIVALCTGVSDSEARRRPAPEAWSLLEVVGHLRDEEREDFRQRLALTLENPTAPWPPIDPAGWVTVRQYNTQDLGATLAAWRTERARSLAWLRSLSSPAWANRHHHPAGFELSAGDLLAAWVAHDLLHMRQLVELRYTLAAARAAPFGVAYAGDR